ncbi:MAG: hypothetical protein ABIC82_05470 [bacterium]
MQPDPNFTTIEELKAAGEEIEHAFPSEFDKDEENISSFQNGEQEIVLAAGIDENVAADEPKNNEETDLLKKIDKYQQKKIDEQTDLEQIYQEVKELKQKLENRIELLKKLQTKSKDFRDELVLIQKEEDIDSLEQRAEYLISNI